jgi:sulfonate transport system permease protein
MTTVETDTGRQTGADAGHRSTGTGTADKSAVEIAPGSEVSGTGTRHPGSSTGTGVARVVPRWLTTTLIAVAVPAAIVGAWYLVTTALGVFAPYQLPSPGQVWDAAVEMTTRGTGPTLPEHVGISAQRVFSGFAFGAAAGLAVGALVGLSRWADSLLSGTVGAFRAVPSLGWVPLLILWIGINEDSKVLLIAIGAFFPVYTTVASALRHVDAQLVEAGRAYGLRGIALLRQVQLPAATPAVIAGLRLALAQAWLFLVAAELIASSKGLGFLLTDSANNGRVDRILLSLVTLAVLGKVTDALIGVGERALARRW